MYVEQIICGGLARTEKQVEIEVATAKNISNTKTAEMKMSILVHDIGGDQN